MAAMAADWFSRGRQRPTRIGFFGTGLIARYIHKFLAGTDWSFDEIGVYDLSADSAAGFRGYLEKSDAANQITVHDSAEQLIRSSDMVVFATIAGEPHVNDLSWFEHNPLVLHVSLRDLSPEILLASTNFVDDVEHCLKANTSPHLAEQLTGNRDFLQGTLGDLMAERVTVPAGTFSCVRVEETWEQAVDGGSPIVHTIKSWYARGVGLVKDETWEDDAKTSMIELTAHTIL